MILLQKYKRSFELSTDHSVPYPGLSVLFPHIHKRKKTPRTCGHKNQLFTLKPI